MEHVVEFISKDMVLINGMLYKRQLTVGGKYSKESRARYMRTWRASKQQRIHVTSTGVI